MPALLVLAGLTAALATTFGKGASNLKPVEAQVVAALLTAASVIGNVPLALLWRGTRIPRASRITSHAELLAISLALLSAGAASVHFAVISEHFAEWWGFGSFFVAAAAAQLTWAVLAVKRPSRPLFWIGASGNLFIMVTWALAHSSGLPFGPEPWRPEKIGLADIAATGLEALIVAGTIALALRVDVLSARRPGRTASAAWLVAIVTVAVVAVSLLSAVGAASGVIPPSG